LHRKDADKHCRKDIFEKAVVMSENIGVDLPVPWQVILKVSLSRTSFGKIFYLR